jgi:hypothetical protein
MTLLARLLLFSMLCRPFELDVIVCVLVETNRSPTCTEFTVKVNGR